MTKRKFFIDTDTASDDAVALLMALEYPDVEVLGVSIVSGNMPVEQGSINARYTIELCEKNVPVYVGSDKPMVKKREHADWFHGPDGMGNMNYPDPQLNEDNSDYMDVLQSLVEQYPNEITLVTLGPLTNVGYFIQKHPESFKKIKNIVIMGGAATTVGNVTPAAEYNIWCDPEAADIVFESGHPDITIVGWELCRGGANLTEEEMDFVYSFKTKKGDFTIVVLKQDRHHVKIVVDGPARGMTIVDELNVGESEPHIDEYWSHTTKNINVIWEIDNKEWKETLYKTLKN